MPSVSTFSLKQSRRAITALLIVAIFLFAGCWRPALAQQDHSFQWWQPVYLEGPIVKPKYRWYLESNSRLNDGLNGINQYLLRGALGYRIRKNLEVAQGYAFISQFVPSYVSEQRIYQQLGIGSVLFNRIQVLNRIRSEQRFFENREGVAERLRYMIRVATPIKRNSSFYLVGYEELFVNVNSLRGGPNAGIDQNRLFAGLGRQLSQKLRFEIGYQYQWVNRSDPTDDQGNHQLMTQTYISF